MTRFLEIQIYADPVCPWCFIGKRRLELALDARPDLSVRLYWRAFQLNPEIPESGMDRATYLASKFDGARRATNIYENIRHVGESVGIDFAFEKIERTPNTVDAHRLIKFATDSTRDELIVERLFNAYFFDGADIGDRNTLIEIARNAGLDVGKVTAELSSDRHFEILRSEGAQARAFGIQGVPSFVFNNQYLLSGAQEPESFFPLFDLAGQPTRNASFE
jgi:predicted DsbA family dithiol-disulfide isomerase